MPPRAELLEIGTARLEVGEGKAVDMDDLLGELDALTDTDERARTDAA
jgi:hypothetical protein